MVASQQLHPGMTLSIDGKLFRVESAIKVNATKGSPFIKAKLKNLSSGQVIEKNFKPSQIVKDVALQERRLEFLYPEGKEYLFLDIGSLEKILVSKDVIGNTQHYLKEGVDLKGACYGDTIFSVELPQFLELMVETIEDTSSKSRGEGTRIAVLETGAKIEVPPFIEAGDIIKVDTKSDEYIQRV